jgi:hypothetical protein
MPLDTAEARRKLRDFNLQGLFIEDLFWDRPGPSLAIPMEGHIYDLRAIAQKRGVQAFECGSGPDGEIPERSLRQKIDREVAKSAHEHLIVFVDHASKRQVWQWVAREPGKPAALREHQYLAGHAADALIQKLDRLRIPINEEEAITITGVAFRLKDAFDKDRVTRRFYDRFRAEHQTFLSFIKGIREVADREWYASLMLNRLMFIYFIQKKGFLDEDQNYLNNRLRRVQREQVAGSFLSFYRYFLERLFHEGLGSTERSPDLEALLGRVPYLNGGLFDVHQLEEQNPDIDIPDEAFEKLFAFFDEYDWHLDDRPLRAGNEINPDVLGYIFEKYINQKQMGAYYTKEDITEYIGKNTIIPFLLDAAARDCAIAFRPGEKGVWDLLKDDPDRYIYPSVLHGVDEPLPEEIAQGIDDVSKRGGWNRPAPDPYALPTETWREHIARRQRCLELRKQLSAGEAVAVNDLVTFNLNIGQFTQDTIERSEGPELLRAFFKAIEKITVLDPACGSGAFLFAALNILQPLYSACLERMEAFVTDLGRVEPGHDPRKFSDFRRKLDEVALHPNRDYFILKSIILNNLYGVDIMEEAVEICKLRLFLKLVAQVETNDQIEPLPDIDFNIRAGNTLVGFSTYEDSLQAFKLDLDGVLPRVREAADDASRAFDRFHQMQTEQDMDAAEFRDAKASVRHRLDSLGSELDRHLAGQFGIEPGNSMAFDNWLRNHEPFHWFVDFHKTMKVGGFDIVIGNPPYVASAKVPYRAHRTPDEQFPDIYASILLRSTSLCQSQGRCSMIVPLSLTFSKEFTKLRASLRTFGTHWTSSFDNIPAALFTGVSQRCTIWIGAASAERGRSYVAPMYRWRSAYRPFLVENLAYTELTTTISQELGLPKLAGEFGNVVLAALANKGDVRKRRSILSGPRQSSGRVGFSQAARNFISVFLEDPPCLDEKTTKMVSASKVGYVGVESPDAALAALAALSSDVFFWYWLTRGDGFDVTSWIVQDFLQCLEYIDDDSFVALKGLGRSLHARRFEALQFKKNAGRYVGNFNYRRMPELTIRASLTLLAGLEIPRSDMVSILTYVDRVLAINEFAGEKSIPPEVKALFLPSPSEPDEAQTINSTDEFLTARLGGDADFVRALVQSQVNSEVEE